MRKIPETFTSWMVCLSLLWIIFGLTFCTLGIIDRQLFDFKYSGELFLIMWFTPLLINSLIGIVGATYYLIKRKYKSIFILLASLIFTLPITLIVYFVTWDYWWSSQEDFVSVNEFQHFTEVVG